MCSVHVGECVSRVLCQSAVCTFVRVLCVLCMSVSACSLLNSVLVLCNILPQDTSFSTSPRPTHPPSDMVNCG